MVNLAAKDGARGLILENTFTSLPDVAQNLMPIIPASLVMTQRLDSMSKIAQYKGPLLQSHGDKDQLIPIQLAKNLFKKAKGGKHFVVIPNGGHNSGRTEKYRKAIDDFLATLPPVSSRIAMGTTFPR